MKRITKEIIDKCDTIEEVLDIATNNGERNYYDIGNQGRNYRDFVKRYEYFKNHISENLPELTTEEVLKFDEYRYKMDEVIYAFRDYGRFLDILYFEQQKNKL